MTKQNKVKLTKQDSENLMPIIREFNKVSKIVAKIRGERVRRKEKKISVMISRVSKPGDTKGNISVTSVAFTKSFLSKQRKNRKKQASNQSEWDDNFSEKRGTII